MTDDDTDTLVAATRLEKAMTGLSDDIKTLRKYGLRNRAMIYGLIVLSVAMAVVLALMVVLFLRVDHNASTAKRASSDAALARQANRATCVAGNESRQLTRELWGYVLDLSSKNPSRTQTAAEKAQIKQFRVYVNKTFADRPCDIVAPAVK